MRSLEGARRKARECRAGLAGGEDRLLESLESHLKAGYGVRFYAVPAEFLDDGVGEIDTSEGRPRLNYDEALDADPARKLELYAHEYGHLVLHQRLTNAGVPFDPVLGSVYLDGGAPALARYNPRSREEAEANAFAVEFLCPSDPLFARWVDSPAATPESFAREMGVSVELVRAQLAEGLYRWVAGEEEEARPRTAEKPTNREQESAATHHGLPLLVDAGPGTGKTKTLVRRIVHLLTERDAAPENLLVLTFSREAADELRERVARAVGDEDLVTRIKVATFHEFGVEILHDHGHLVGLPEKLIILDEDAQHGVISRVLGRVDCDEIIKLKDLDETARETARHITFLKDRLVTPSLFLESVGDGDPGHPRALHAVFTAYEAEKERMGAVDFADLIRLPSRILENDALRAQFREKYRWVMVDEYQDVSRSVATLLRQLCGESNPPWVVGDARQAIYRFRGAAPENVTEFAADFPGAARMSLSLNYRSSTEVVSVANRLSTLMPDVPADGGTTTWEAATSPAPVLGTAVEIVEADSDRAEYDAVAGRVRQWMQQDGAAPGDIAVLARRNIDVRNIALALNRAGIPAVTTGLLTPEGAGGDLAAVLALVDAPRAAVPRLVQMLGSGRFPANSLSEVTTMLLAVLRGTGNFPEGGGGEADQIGQEIRQLHSDLVGIRFSGDAWDVLGAFLFGHGTYLRRLIAGRVDAESDLNLEEVLTTLGLAARHRFTAPPAERRTSRLTFAARFRDSLTNAAGGTLAPRGGARVVRVMTCHASKGLEFPFVAVAGQSLPQRTKGYPWLSGSLKPKADEDSLQADALLFVGVTRGQRSVSVSFATTRSALPGATARKVPRLLERWRQDGTIPVRVEAHGPVARDSVRMGSVWGGSVPDAFTGYALTPNCSIRTYLQEHLALDFPAAETELYPTFVWRCRHALRSIVRLAHDRRAGISGDEAEEILREVWPEDDFAEHPHLTVYLPRALAYVRAFAGEYDPGDEEAEVLPLDVEVAEEPGGRLLRTDLVAHVRTRDGTNAVIFRPEMLELAKKGGGIKWSALSEHHRLVFVLLRARDKALNPKVFMGSSGKIITYNWSTQKREEGLQKATDGARASAVAQEAGFFEHVMDDYGCDRCSSRIICPVWIGSVMP